MDGVRTKVLWQMGPMINGPSPTLHGPGRTLHERRSQTILLLQKAGQWVICMRKVSLLRQTRTVSRGSRAPSTLQDRLRVSAKAACTSKRRVVIARTLLTRFIGTLTTTTLPDVKAPI
jgi:hypothetical protein